jgi:FO synthase
VGGDPMSGCDRLNFVQCGDDLSDQDAIALVGCNDLTSLMARAAALRDEGHGAVMSYSRKVFIPLTKLCRNSCHYCTFAHSPQKDEPAFLSPDEILSIARAGAKWSCHEALFTLGDKPELRYRAARDELAGLGHASTISYLLAMAALVREETGLLPHLNPGVLTAEEIAQARTVSVSQGLMLESASERLCRRGGPHFGSPDKVPKLRLNMIRMAGEARVPFTSGLLIGIGETRRERMEALLALRTLHRRFGHLQELIIQNFRAKPGTRMADHAEPLREDHLWTIAVARILFGAKMNIQAPPNLSADVLPQLIAAGINDWGGISPVTPDHVNPERPWPHLASLQHHTFNAGKLLVERIAVYPAYVQDLTKWIDPKLQTAVRRAADAEGFARIDAWMPGSGIAQLPAIVAMGPRPQQVSHILERAYAGNELGEDEVVTLFSARGITFDEVCAAADALRAKLSGDRVSYVVTRNINYTNICGYHCNFCAFSKGKTHANLRGRPYNLDLTEIVRRCGEAWERGAVEVCLQGGIHPDYTGNTYLSICRAIHDAFPRLHIHAFSPLEISQGAATLDMPVYDFLAKLKKAGLGSLPGTAAEILDDEVRTIICPDKLNTAEWLAIVETAHRVGFEPHRRSCSGTSIRRAIGRNIFCVCEPCSNAPAALLNSCPCRSCRWNRQSIYADNAASARHSAKPF